MFKCKRIIRFVLVLCIFSMMFPGISLATTYNIGTSSYDVFRSQTIGKKFDVDNAYGVQCVDGAAVLWQQFGRYIDTGGTGGAHGCWDVESARKKNAGTEFDLVYNFRDVKRGDVIVMLNRSENSFGHICFADEDYNGTDALKIYGQNQNKIKEFNVLNHKSIGKYFLGAFRLKKWAGHKVTVTANNCRVTGVESEKYYKKGETITLSVTPNEGYKFTEWAVTGGALSSTTSTTTTLTIQDSDVEVTAKTAIMMGALGKSWSGSATATKTNATISGTLTIDAGALTGLSVILGTNVTDVTLVASQDSSLASNPSSVIASVLSGGGANLYMKSFKVPSATVTNISGGRRYVYNFSCSSVSELKNMFNSNMTVTPGTKYYYCWFCKVNDTICRSNVLSFTTKAGSASWGTPGRDSETGNFYAYVYYDNHVVTIKELGIFMSTDYEAIKAAKYGNFSSNVENLKDTSNIDYNSNYKGTYVFYKPASFKVNTFKPGVTYYYKFYSRDADGEILYSSPISSYTPAGTVTKYNLTINAGTGGSISAGASGSYASGNKINISAVPEDGYSFTNWTKTAGTIDNPTASSTIFTMPSSAATVTAHFEPCKYSLRVYTTNDGGTVSGVSSGTYWYGEMVSLKATPRDGYTFVGWSSDNGGSFSDASNPETAFTIPAGSVNVYADFALIDYNISLIASGGGSISTSSSTAHMGDVIILQAEPFEGYHFAGWDIGTGSITSKEAYFELTMPAYNITITAYFEHEDYFELRDESKTIVLPEAITEIYSESFANVAAKYFMIPRNARKIESNVFPEGSVVFLWNAGSMNISPLAINGSGLYVEMSDTFDTVFATAVSATDNFYCMRDGSRPGKWSEWSEWSTTPIEAGNEYEVESKTQYRSAVITTSQILGDWSGWSTWSGTRQSIQDATLKQEDIRTLYPYYYFSCSSCGAHMPYWGSNSTCYTSLGGCGRKGTILDTSWSRIWLTTPKSSCTPFNDEKRYTGTKGQYSYYYNESSQSSKNEYRYRTRNYEIHTTVGEYSEWGDLPIESSSTLTVETRVVYRSRHQIN